MIVYNKADLTGIEGVPKVVGNRIWMAAAKGIGVEKLTELVRDLLYADVKEGEYLFPYDRGSELSYVMGRANVLASEYLPEGVKVRALCGKELRERLRKYEV